MKDDQYLRLIRTARGLEAEGMYNASKLLWAMAFSDEIKSSNQAGIPRAEMRDHEMTAIIGLLYQSDGKPELLDALAQGLHAATEHRSILHSEIPNVYVCRLCGDIMLGAMPSHCTGCHAPALTFREILPSYYMEPLTPAQAIAALESAPDAVEASVQGMSEEQMNQRPEPEEWSAREVLLEICGAEALLAARVKKILSEDHPSLVISSAELAMNMEEVQPLPAAEILRLYRQSRAATLQRLSGLALEDWARGGIHQEWGEVTLLGQAGYFARHEYSHIPQIEAARRVIGA